MRRSSKSRTTVWLGICSRSFLGSPKRFGSSMDRAEGRGERFVPAKYQPPLPLEKLIIEDGAEGAGDRMELDVVIVGAGPAGLACAIALAQLAKADGSELNIGVLEKAEALGEHSLSGAVVNPRALRELFPDLKDSDFPFRAPVTKEAVYLLTERGKIRLPTPPTMHNRGYHMASLCEIVRWLGTKAEELGVNIFTGFPAAQLLVREQAVAGVRTAAAGLDRDGRPSAGAMAPNEIAARGWGAGRMGSQDDPRGWLPLASAAARGRRRRRTGRRGWSRGRALAERNPLRDPVRRLCRSDDFSESQDCRIAFRV